MYTSAKESESFTPCSVECLPSLCKALPVSTTQNSTAIITNKTIAV